MSEVTYLTKAGLEKLKKELEHLMNVERPTISKQIGEAIEKGDISENAEYDAAKDAQGMLEAKISQLKSKVANARILDESKIDTSKVKSVDWALALTPANTTTEALATIPFKILLNFFVITVYIFIFVKIFIIKMCELKNCSYF